MLATRVVRAEGLLPARFYRHLFTSVTIRPYSQMACALYTLGEI
jgi:hypothetical protein